MRSLTIVVSLTFFCPITTPYIDINIHILQKGKLKLTDIKYVSMAVR